ncbi:MAG: hypothetical protein ACRCZF_15515 [Gemmataceae bacterium]
MFRPSTHGFPFPNWFPPGTPVMSVPTPLGTLRLGDAHGGLCGGMIFTALDCYSFNVPIPQEITPAVLGTLTRRLLDSFNFPFGVLKYYDLMRQAAPANFAITQNSTWPLVQRELDAGRLVPLGLVKAQSWWPADLAKNHQVLAYRYSICHTSGRIRVNVYDPNYAADDDCFLEWDPQAEPSTFRIDHAREGPSGRSIFITHYVRPAAPPNFDSPPGGS